MSKLRKPGRETDLEIKQWVDEFSTSFSLTNIISGMDIILQKHFQR